MLKGICSRKRSFAPAVSTGAVVATGAIVAIAAVVTPAGCC